MIAVDTNILVYAHRQETPFHAIAKAQIEQLCVGQAGWGIPVACISEFLSITTNARVFSQVSDYGRAIAQLDAWLGAPSARVLHSGALHWPLLKKLAHAGRLACGQFHDARIAAICLENAVNELWSADRDFSRFPQLKVRNPLIHT
jgi:uncharacterized protein